LNAVLSEDLEILEPPATSEATPEEAIRALRRYRGSVLIDLDETLYLRNSTEDFVDSARPALLALILMRLLDAIRPWRWTGGDATRDVWRVRCILLFFPWTKARWPRHAARLAQASANTALIDALNERARGADNEPPVIATIGFEFIVAPLIAALGLPPRTRLIAARHSVFTDRAAGKLTLLSAVLGQGRVLRSLVLTDSAQDEPLLERCALPLHTVWPQARFQPAFSQVYLPGQYLSRVKRPGERYISRGILQDDFAVWVLASLSFTLAQPLLHFTGLLCLLFSFWTIYECGYVDNDRVADHFEREPKLTREYREAPVATPRWAPWGWALASGAVGAVLLRGADLLGVYAFIGWAAVLLATYSVFLIYNRLEKSTRIWWYPFLQLLRTAAIVVLVPVSAIGTAAMAAHTLAKWQPYYMYRVYRVPGGAWPKISHFLPRLLFFVIIAIALSFAMGVSVIWNWSAAALLAWNVYRARRELFPSLFERRRAPVIRGDLTFR
jgi:hypothetical protein